ncbi:high mobility group B protein 14 [Cornus florida]|uniref:high mobility group B protein 14 n=1 Tax=Cornus florida TaxID=4283 RepID=UPI002898A571|nr:high mobility group B protein 14 [Cornus florida]
MAKKATKKSQKSTSASASASKPARIADGKMVFKITSTEKMKKAVTNRSRLRSAKPITTLKKKAMKIEATKPKKPPTAFFYFLEDFRKGFQEQNPDVKSMRDVGKACGEKWKTMTYEEKVHYYDIATEKRAEFDRAVADYIKRKESGEDQEAGESDFDEDY